MAIQPKDIKLKEIVEFRGRLNVLGSGLRIGGSKDGAGIGELDNSIIRNPITNLPYVPGSSIKGKVRSLLESRHCPETQQTGRPCGCGKCAVCELFGCANTAQIQSPTRLVFRDCHATDETRRVWQDAGTDSEVKTEASINRKTGTAHDPRQVERIPAGSSFDFAFSLRTFEGDNVGEYYEFLAEGFELLEKHYLGGCGSRGYGQVAVTAEDGTPMAQHLRKRAKEC